MSGKTGRAYIAAAEAAVRAALLPALLACALPAQGADWPMFRGNPARTGYASEQAAPPLTKLWEFPAPGGIVSSPAVYDGRVYIGSRANKIYALDAATGALLWERLTAGWVDSSPAVYGNAVYAACLGGRLYSMDRLSGELLWIADLGAASASSPLVLAGRVYVGTGSPENKLKVYSAATGALVGSYQAAQPVDSAPSTDGSYVYFGANDGKVYALDPVSLAPRWPAYPTLGSFGQNAVAVSSGTLYFLPGRDEKKASALAAGTGALLAASPQLTKTGPWTQAGSPAVDGAGVLYFTAGAASAAEEPARLAALSSATLSAVWPSSASLGGVSAAGVLASPALANEVVYAATPGGRLIAVSSAAGAPLEDVNLFGPAYASPAVSNGLVIAANYEGMVIGFRARYHAAVSSPAAGEILNGTVPVSGYFASPGLLAGYELEYSTGGALPQWTRISSAATTSPAVGGVLANWDLSDLANGDYTLRLRVLESSPSGYDASASVRVRVNAVPLPPSGLAADDVDGDGGNALALSWTASPTPGVSSYRIYRDDGSGYVLYASAPGLSYTDTSALTGRTFAYAVSAYDGWSESERCEEVYAVSVNDSGDSVPPGAVGDLEAAPGLRGGAVELAWTATGDDGDSGEVSYYLIRYSTDPAQDWGDFLALAGGSRTADGLAGITEVEETGGLFGGVTYYFSVKAVDDAGNSGPISNVASAWAARDPLPPLPPGGLTVADAPGDEGGALDLAWTLSPDDGAGAGDVYGYKVFRSGAAGAFVSTAPHASVGARVASYRDPAATLNIRYFYAVAAFDSTGDSALSAEASGVSADNWRFFDAAGGGVVRTADGMEVQVPAASASQNDKIMVTRLDPATYEPLARVRSSASANPTDIVYEVRFQNPATRLLAPATVSLPYTAADVAGMQEENLRLYTLSGGSWVMLNTSSADIAAKKVSAEVAHFSIFRIMEYLPSGALFADNEVYTYPNPATGDTVTFKVRVAYKSYVKVDVYNVAGEKVAALERADCPAGQASELVWDIRNIASGVYVYRLEAQSAAGSRSVVKKLAVVH
jgi:outer membrane protein assembly factor BamB